MELYQIRYFLAVSRTLNFTHAAAECNVSQPALTRAVQKLEAELGGELFRRERRRTHLTELGRAIVPLLQQSLDSAEMAKEQAEEYGRGDIAPLRLGLSETVPLKLFSVILHELVDAFPGLRLELTRAEAADVMDKLESGDLDVAVTGVDGAKWDRFDGWPLFDEAFVLCVAADGPLADVDRANPGTLTDISLIARSHCENVETVCEALENSGIRIEYRHSIDRERDFLTVVASGAGAGIAPACVTMGEAAVRSVPIENLDEMRTVSLFAVAGRRHSTAAAGLIRLVRASDWAAEKLGTERL